MALQIKTKAPDFEGETASGEKIGLKDFKGKWLVLYFYPKDNTPGCTKEACAFRDNMEQITEKGAEVVGVSPDQIESHEKFASKFNLNFILIADPEKKICEDYDVFGEKNMFGKTVFGLKRSTYIIDPDGVIQYVWRNVRVAGHVETVMKKLDELKEKAA